jgi:hypothetical protein
MLVFQTPKREYLVMCNYFLDAWKRQEARAQQQQEISEFAGRLNSLSISFREADNHAKRSA